MRPLSSRLLHPHIIPCIGFDIRMRRGKQHQRIEFARWIDYRIKRASHCREHRAFGHVGRKFQLCRRSIHERHGLRSRQHHQLPDNRRGPCRYGLIRLENPILSLDAFPAPADQRQRKSNRRVWRIRRWHYLGTRPNRRCENGRGNRQFRAVQVIGSANFSAIPSTCTSQGQPEEDWPIWVRMASWESDKRSRIAARIVFTSGSAGVYYACPSGGCVETTESLAQQVQNPVASFASDNNGVIVELPAISGTEATASGSLIFGIGTQSNNSLGGATVFGTDAFGDLGTTYQGTLTRVSWIADRTPSIFWHHADHPVTGVPRSEFPLLSRVGANDFRDQ